MSENLFIPLFIFSLWFLIESYYNNNIYWNILAGFSLFYLYFTRSIAVAFIFGFMVSFIYYIYYCKKNKSISSILRTKSTLLLSFIVPMVLMLNLKKYFGVLNIVPNSPLSSPFFNTNSVVLSPPGAAIYLNTLLSIFRDMAAIKDFLLAFIHTAEYLVLSSHFLFLFIALFMIAKILAPIFKPNIYTPNLFDENQEKSLRVVSIYFLVSLLMLTLISVGYCIAQCDNCKDCCASFQIIGRFVDPLVPLIFIIGFIGLDQFIKNKEKFYESYGYLLITIYILTLVLFLLTFPFNAPYRHIETLAILYISCINSIISAKIFLVVMAIGFLFITYLSIYKKIFIKFLFLSVIIFSLLCSYCPYREELNISTSVEEANQIGRYLQKYSTDDTLVLMDREDFNDSWGGQMWSLTWFWTRGSLILRSTKDDPSEIGRAHV